MSIVRRSARSQTHARNAARAPRLHASAPALVGLVLAAACGQSPGPNAPAAGATLTCPAPIGAVQREDCAEIADDYGAFNVSGALQIAGTGKESEIRLEAIRATAALAESLKKQRVAACESYMKCEVRFEEHAAKDKLFGDAMRALIDLWNKRRFSRTEEIVRFREAVREIDRRVNGDPAGGGPRAPTAPPKVLKASDALAPTEGTPGVTYKAEGTSRVATITGPGMHEVMRSRPEAMPLAGGHRYRVKVMGSFTPAWPVFIQPGEEITVRLKYRAAQAAELAVALRSLEDPEAGEATSVLKLAAGKGANEAKLTADEQSSGFYLGVGVRGAAVDLDDVEIVAKDKVVAAARAESADEPGVKSECAPLTAQPLAGKTSLRCAAGNGDRLTIGKPLGHVEIALADTVRDLSAVKTASLQGGRSVDAALKEDSQLVIRVLGAGTLTIERVEVTDLGQ